MIRPPLPRPAVAGLVVAAAVLCAAGPAEAVDIRNAYAHVAPAGTSAAVYLTLAAADAETDLLVGAHTDHAARSALHTHIIDDAGIARMRAVEGGIPVASGTTVALEPGGLHVMLMGVRDLPTPGGCFALALEFAGAGTVTVPVKVMKRGAKAHDHSHNH